MYLSSNYSTPGARMNMGDGKPSIELRHIDLEIIADHIEDLLARSRANLLRKQLAEIPSHSTQAECVGNLFICCAPPANYDNWGLNEEGESWLLSFCRPDDFGNAVPADPFFHGSDHSQRDRTFD